MKLALSALFGLGICTLGSLFATGEITLAQVTSDGTVNTEVNQNGNVSEITGGETRGSNLFHSFREFSVQTGNEAFFNNANTISNIFSRVTGGNVSHIDGLLRANGGASLFLINPAGIIFGNNARLDIGGSFYGSSASGILFEDGEFSATNLNNPPLLTINAPIGLNFRDNPGDIVNRSFVQNDSGENVGLSVLPGNNLTLVGGNINFEAGEATASGGNIELGGLSEAGIVSINPDGSLSFPENLAKADISLSNGADVDARGTGGGNVTVNARNLELTAGEFGSGRVDASTFGQGNAGAVNITATGNITFEGENSSGIPSNVASQVSPDAVGNAGGVTISTNNLTLIKGGLIDASTFGEGNAGEVNITATGDITFEGENSNGLASSGATSQVTPDAVGNAGGVTISTTNLTLTNGGRIDSSTSGRGNAGAVNITATGDITFDGEDSLGFPSNATSQVAPDAVGDSGGVTISTGNLTLTNGGRVEASTFGEGNAGAVNITATGDLTFDGETSSGIPSNVSSQVFPDALGNSGGVKISTNNLTLTNGGTVDASTFGEGNAGAVNITATGDLTFDGETSGGSNSGVASTVNSDAVGDAGGVTISTANLTLTNGGRVDASTFGRGNAGAVNITATGDLTFDGEDSGGNPSGVASTVNSDAVGDAGGVTISTTNLTLTNGGRVAATTVGQGDAGSVKITATESITIDGIIERFRSGISADALERDGNGGNVNIITDRLRISNGGTIEATNFDGLGAFAPGTGRPGNITIKANNIDLVDRGRIEAETRSTTGLSAIINLQVAEDITLDNNSFISARAFGDANGGNLNIDARFIVAFPNGNNDIIADARQGNGGDIKISAESLFGIEERPLNDFTNDINASSARGAQFDGNVAITTPEVDAIRGATELPTNVIEAQQTTAEACSANPDNGEPNGLIVKGKGGIQPAPDLPLSAEILSVGGKIVPESNTSNTPTNPASTQIKPIQTNNGEIYPAMGIVETEDGRIILTAYHTNNTQRIPHSSPHCGKS